MVREKRGGQGEDAWSIKYDNVHIQLRIIIKFPVNPIIIFLSTWEFRSLSKASSPYNLKPKSKARAFYEALHAGL